MLVLIAKQIFRRVLIFKFKPTRTAHSQTPATFGLNAQSVWIPATDGGRLFAWWIPVPENEAQQKPPVAIVLHGWGASASDMLDLAPWIYRGGFHALYIDARCHGKSTEAAFSSMPRFAEDLESARDWVHAHYAINNENMIGIGHSVGAGAVLLSASRSRWAGVVSLSAFAHPADVLWRFLKNNRIKNRRIGNWVISVIESIVGARFDEIAPENTVSKSCCPVMLIHGADDQEVPLAESLRLFQNAPKDTTKIVSPNVGHDMRPALKFIAPATIDFMRRSTRR